MDFLWLADDVKAVTTLRVEAGKSGRVTFCEAAADGELGLFYR